LGARIANKLLGAEWSLFILGHSSFYIARYNIQKSKLFYPDKYWHCLIPLWVYKVLASPTGEFKHYREMTHARQVAKPNESDIRWWKNLQKVCKDKMTGNYSININKLAQ
jgi:hypothetical protein